jgi:CheY-like chemotaxis protein
VAFSRTNLTGLTVLIMDDDDDLLALLNMALTARGASVVTARSVAEAKQSFAGVKPHALVADLIMPDGGGYALIAYIRKLSDTESRYVPAIALSSASDEGTRRTALRSGFWRFVPKPIDMEFLCSEVATVGETYRQ